MKRLYSFAMAMGTAVLATAQLTGVSIESVLTHDASIDPSLDGYTTYRIYADVTSSTDFVSAVFGDAPNPLVLGCTGDIYQSLGVNFNYAIEVNPLFFGTFPAGEYDSWFTIGSEDANGGVSIQSTAATMDPALALFNAGEGFTINDPIGASWFNVFPCTSQQTIEECAATSSAFGGDDNRVLIAQITATGDVYGIFNFQIFPNGVQAEQQQSTGTFSSNANDVFGCTNPAATNYDMTATLDDLSCVLPCTVSLSVDNVTPPSCNGENDALIQVLASGAQGTDDYYLDAIEGTAQNFGNFGSLVAGMYTVYVVDAAGCTDSLEVEVPVTEVVVVNAVLTSGITCFGEEDAVISVDETTGGSGIYEYYISTNPLVVTTQTEWTGLAGGQAPSIYAIDSNGCIGESSSVPITNPTEIFVDFAASADVIDATCANTPDGEIYLYAFGGSAPTTIEFSVDGENYGPSPLLVSGGTYTVTAQDVFGCTGTMAQEVVVGPDAIDVNLSSTPEVCFGSEDGQVSWAPEGGQGVYMYAFGGEATTETSVSDLAPGTYEVTVTDEEGCSETASVEVAAGVEIMATAVSTDASCFGDDDGEVELFAEGGDGTFQYSDDGNSFEQDNEFDDLIAGTYNFFVQDGNGCVETVEATIGEPEAIVVTGIVSEGSVTGEGTIDVTVTGGSLPYTYEWIGPGVSGQDGQDLEGISTGSYTVDVTDDNGCTTQETFNITTDIRELGAGVTATVFPNPSQGEFVVEVQGGFQGAMDFLILDAQGRTIQAGQWTATSGAFRTTLDLSGAEAGMYRLVLMANGRPNSLQLVKTH